MPLVKLKPGQPRKTRRRGSSCKSYAHSPGQSNGTIRVRRYLCRLCKRTVSLLPEFAVDWLRFSITVISLFLIAHLVQGLPLLGWPDFLAPKGQRATLPPATRSA